MSKTTHQIAYFNLYENQLFNLIFILSVLQVQ
jgi:hypothetical protein